MSGGQRWLDYCLDKPGAWRDEPWDGDVVAKVGDRIFAFLGSAETSTTIGLKCGDREQADLLLERYPGAARKMPYIGQHGWNTFALDGDIPDDDLREFVDLSYELVVAKLPKAKRPPERTTPDDPLRARPPETGGDPGHRLPADRHRRRHGAAGPRGLA